MRIEYTEKQTEVKKVKLEKEKMSRTIKQAEIEDIREYPEVKRWLRKLESEYSRKNYVRLIIRYCEATEKNPSELIELKKKSTNHEAEDLLDEFIDEAEKIKYSNSMIYSITIAIRSFYKWNYHDLSAGAGKYTRHKKKVYRTPDKKTLRKYLKGANLRDTALINFMAASGIAVGSIPNLKWKHVNLNEDVPHIGLKPEEIKGKGKGIYSKIEQHTFLTPFAKQALIDYKTWKERKQQKELTSEDYMFTSMDTSNEKLGLSGIRTLFLRRSENAGITFSPHDMRRFVQTALETARLQPSWIKKILRHKISGEEAPYSQPKIEALRKAYAEAIPQLDLGEKPEVNEVEKRKQAILDSARLMPEMTEAKIEFLKDWLKGAMSMEDIEERLNKRLEMFKRLEEEDCQKIVDEQDVERWLAKGWRVINTLPSGRIVIESNNNHP